MSDHCDDPSCEGCALAGSVDDLFEILPHEPDPEIIASFADENWPNLIVPEGSCPRCRAPYLPDEDHRCD